MFELWKSWSYSQRVCRSSTIAVVQSNTSAESSNSSQQPTHSLPQSSDSSQQPTADSAVVTLSHSSEEIPPMFQILLLPELGR